MNKNIIVADINSKVTARDDVVDANALAIGALSPKTAYSKNITIEEWNQLIANANALLQDTSKDRTVDDALVAATMALLNDFRDYAFSDTHTGDTAYVTVAVTEATNETTGVVTRNVVIRCDTQAIHDKIAADIANFRDNWLPLHYVWVGEYDYRDSPSSSHHQYVYEPKFFFNPTFLNSAGENVVGIRDDDDDITPSAVKLNISAQAETRNGVDYSWVNVRYNTNALCILDSHESDNLIINIDQYGIQINDKLQIGYSDNFKTLDVHGEATFEGRMYLPRVTVANNPNGNDLYFNIYGSKGISYSPTYSTIYFYGGVKAKFESGAFTSHVNENDNNFVDDELVPSVWVKAQDTAVLNAAKSYANSQIAAAMVTVMHYKGSVSTWNDLPNNPTTGDMYNIQTADLTHNVRAGDNVAWNGSSWDVLGAFVDMEAKLDKTNFGYVIADHTYDPTCSYNEGDTVYYDGYLYVAQEDITAPAGDFNYSKWSTITLERLIWYKQDKLYDTGANKNIKKINGQSILGSGSDIQIDPGVAVYVIDVTGTSGTLSDADVAKIAANPQNCILHRGNIYLVLDSVASNIAAYKRIGHYSGDTYTIASIQINITTGAWNYIYEESASLEDKQNALTWNPTVPEGTTPTQLTGIKDGNNYYAIPQGSPDALEVVEYQTTTPLTSAQIAKAKAGKLAVLKDGALCTLIGYTTDFLILASTTATSVNGSYFPREVTIAVDKISIAKATGYIAAMATYTHAAIRDTADNALDYATLLTSNGTKVVRELNLYRTQAMMTAVYDATSTYAVGTYCIYQNKLYKCTNAIETAEAWNSGHWTETTLAAEVRAAISGGGGGGSTITASELALMFASNQEVEAAYDSNNDNVKLNLASAVKNVHIDVFTETTGLTAEYTAAKAAFDAHKLVLAYYANDIYILYASDGSTLYYKKANPSASSTDSMQPSYYQHNIQVGRLQLSSSGGLSSSNYLTNTGRVARTWSKAYDQPGYGLGYEALEDFYKTPNTNVNVSQGDTITDTRIKEQIGNHAPVILNGYIWHYAYTCFTNNGNSSFHKYIAYRGGYFNVNVNYERAKYRMEMDINASTYAIEKIHTFDISTLAYRGEARVTLWEANAKGSFAHTVSFTMMKRFSKIRVLGYKNNGPYPTNAEFEFDPAFIDAWTELAYTMQSGNWEYGLYLHKPGTSGDWPTYSLSADYGGNNAYSIAKIIGIGRLQEDPASISFTISHNGTSYTASAEVGMTFYEWVATTFPEDANPTFSNAYIDGSDVVLNADYKIGDVDGSTVITSGSTYTTVSR